jgi:uncharacterized protein YpmB
MKAKKNFLLITILILLLIIVLVVGCIILNKTEYKKSQGEDIKTEEIKIKSEADPNELYYYKNEDGTYEVSSDERTENCTIFNLPEEHNSAIVTTISENAFKGSNAVEINIPDSITKIEKSAFICAEKLKEVKFGKNVKQIGESAFFQCTSLEEVILPDSLEVIDDATFLSCTSLKKVTLPEGIKEIGATVFGNCEKLTEINIPSSVKKIQEYTFDGCSSLEKIKIPEGIEEIEFGAFDGCSSLKELHLPSSIKILGKEGWPIFDKNTIPTIYAPTGSYAEEYAKSNGISFVEE